jgi:hypothetical protein
MKRTVVSIGTILIVACGGRVVVDTDGTDIAATDPPPAAVCDGHGRTCGPNEWCQWHEHESCGGTGVCKPIPIECPAADCMPVCGCDGLAYCNACEASAMGSDVGTCDGFESGLMGAYMLPTDAPRYMIAKAAYGTDRCVFIVVAGLDAGISEIETPAGWVVERMGITPHASDCEPSGTHSPVLTETVETDVGRGMITLGGCFTSVKVSMTFPSDRPSWAPEKAGLQGNDIVVWDCGG